MWKGESYPGLYIGKGVSMEGSIRPSSVTAARDVSESKSICTANILELVDMYRRGELKILKQAVESD